MNAKELSQRMAGEAAAIAQYLLPGGKRKAGEWAAGSTNGEEGQSLSVRLTGAKAGVWADFIRREGRPPRFVGGSAGTLHCRGHP